MNQDYKILLADDEVLWLNIIKSVLEKNGYQVFITTNPCEVKQLVLTNNVDIVLLDVNFPEINGLEICRNIKLDPITERVVVIMLTSQDDPTDLKKGFDAGANDYIEKHSSSLELLERIKVLLKAKKENYSLILYKKLFENSPYAIMILKQDIINSINNRFMSILGYENPDGLIDSKIEFLIHEDEFEKFSKQLSTVSIEGQKHSFPYKFKCKDGQYLNLVVHMIRIGDQETALYCNTFS